jgi:hypothetical protein
MKKSSMDYYLDIITLFDDYMTALSSDPRQKASRLNDLRTQIKDDMKRWEQIAVDDFPLRWLMVNIQA